MAQAPDGERFSANERLLVWINLLAIHAAREAIAERAVMSREEVGDVSGDARRRITFREETSGSRNIDRETGNDDREIRRSRWAEAVGRNIVEEIARASARRKRRCDEMRAQPPASGETGQPMATEPNGRDGRACPFLEDSRSRELEANERIAESSAEFSNRGSRGKVPDVNDVIRDRACDGETDDAR